jgi:hypothetical protein
MRPLLALFAVCTLVAAERPALQVPCAAAAPSIDGALDEPAWAGAAVVTGLSPARGGERTPAFDLLATEIRLLWDAEALYISFRCVDDEAWASGRVAHDGDVYMEDVVEVFVDPQGDGRQWMEFQVNPLNTTLDLMSLNVGDGAAQPNGRLVSTADLFHFRAWEAPGLRTATGRFAGGWTAELAIPAAVLTKRSGGGPLTARTMRGNLMRYDHRPQADGKRELLHMNWAPVAHGCPHISPAAMGDLILLPAAPSP